MPNKLPDGWIERIFQRLHGRFGNTFINKFKNGVNDANGNDIGIENAKMVWAEELAGLSAERIANGLKFNFEHTPSCDDFKRACAPVIASHKDFIALPKPTLSKDERMANLDKFRKQAEALGVKLKNENYGG